MILAGIANTMATITIDDQHYDVDDGQNLLSACLSLKKNLPYFCWHPAMGSVGACRQCAVIQYKDAEDRSGKLVMSCMTPVNDGDIFALEDPRAQEFRAGIIENLMINHPHDCPVCEEGGECHLQDMTIMSGHTLRRFQGLKRTHHNQFLGPFIKHEMNRCIACYRCVRFYRDYAGGTDLQALGRNHQVYFGRQEDGVLDNGFSGNLVEVCPTGVFTDKTFSRHYVRKWDLQTAPSVCEHCAVGCNTAPGARRDGKGAPAQLRRVTNLFHRQINGYFLCDRGRFGYEYVNSRQRIYRPLVADTQTLIHSTAGNKKVQHPMAPGDAVAKLADTLDAARAGKQRLLGIGSSRSALENNFALQSTVGKENFYAGMDARNLALLQRVDRIQRDPRIHTPGTPDMEQADMLLVLGEDIANTAPRIALALRQAARSRQRQAAEALGIPQWQDDSIRQLTGEKTPVLITAVERSDLDDIATCRLHTTPEKIADLARALTQAIGGEYSLPEIPGLTDDAFSELVAQLKKARRPLIVSGCGLQSEALLQAVSELAIAIAEREPSERAQCQLYLACPDANSLGLAQLCDADKHLDQLNQELQHRLSENRKDGIKTSLLVMETDLYRQLPPSTAEQILDSVDEVIQLEVIHNRTSARADLVMPAAAIPEYEGTLVNSSGLAQRHYAVYEGSGWIQASWRWLANAAAACAARAGSPEKTGRLQELAQWQHVTQLSCALADSYPTLAPLAELGPDWDQTIEGQKTARQPHRYSGRTALEAEIQVAEEKPLPDADAPLSFSMEGIHFASQSPLQVNNWAPGWNSNQAIHRYQPRPGMERLGKSSGQPLARSPEAIETGLAERTAPLSEKNAIKENGRLRVLPIYRMFGSGELSNRAAAIASVIGEPFAIISPETLNALGIQPGSTIEIQHGSDQWQLQVQVSRQLAQGYIGICAGFEHVAPMSARYLSPAQISVVETGSA